MNADPSRSAEALRLAMADDFASHALYLGRSLRQMVRAGHRYAMVPYDLAGVGLLEQVVDGLLDDDGPAPICGGVYLDPGVAWVCLVAPDHLDSEHGWPDEGVRERTAAALFDQTDPIARIERRALMALEGPSRVRPPRRCYADGMRCLPTVSGPVDVVLPSEGPCVACSLGDHPDVDHDGCDCPCGWSVARRRTAITVTVRPEKAGGWWACHGRPL